MNPQSGQSTGFNLLPPSYEQIARGPEEQYGATAPALQSQPSGQPVPPIMQSAAPVSASGTQAPDQQPRPVAPSGSIPQDGDGGALDQEWVDKAKDIIARTHADPYMQSLEIGRLKAQYIKARYNKDIKIIED